MRADISVTTNQKLYGTHEPKSIACTNGVYIKQQRVMAIICFIVAKIKTFEAIVFKKSELNLLHEKRVIHTDNFDFTDEAISIRMGWRCSVKKKNQNSCEKLIKLIQQHRWNKVLSFVSNLDAEGEQKVRSYVTNAGGTCTHELCYFDAPLEIIIAIIDFCPQHVQRTDNENRTPLFTAAACGASALVISSLIALYPRALEIKDKGGRTPLIAACMHEHFGGVMRDGQSLRYRQNSVIEELLFADSSAALVADTDGITALEYAILGNAGKAAVNLLQKATAAEEKIKFELENTAGRTRSTTVTPLIKHRNGSTIGTTILPKNPLEWQCYKISPMFDERNKNRIRQNQDDNAEKTLSRSDPIVNSEMEDEFINAAILQFMGIPQEDWGRKDSIPLDKVKKFKIWKTICEARENLENTIEDIPMIIHINGGESIASMSTL